MFTIQYENGTLSAPGTTFTITNNQDIRILLPYTVTGGDSDGKCTYQVQVLGALDPINASQTVDGPHMDEIHFGSTGHAYFGKLMSFSQVGFATTRDLNRMQRLSNGLHITRTYAPLTAWDIGRIDQPTESYWRTTAPYQTWVVVGDGGVPPLKIGIKNTTPWAYQRKLPISWKVDDVALTDAAGSFQLDVDGGLRGEDAVTCALTSADHGKLVSADVTIYNDATMTTSTTQRKMAVVGLVKTDPLVPAIRTPSHYFTTTRPARIGVQMYADHSTGWGDGAQTPANYEIVADGSVIGSVTGAGVWDYLLPHSSQETVQITPRFSCPRDAPHLTGETVTVSGPSKTFHSLLHFSRDPATTLQPTHDKYELVTTPASFYALAANDVTPPEKCVVFSDQEIDGPFVLCFEMIVPSGTAFVSLSDHNDITGKYHPAFTDGHNCWRNQGAADNWWSVCGINIDKTNGKIGLYQNRKIATEYTLDTTWAKFYGEGDINPTWTSNFDEAVYTDEREVHRIPFTIRGMRTVAYDYMQPELWELGPKGVASFRDETGAVIPSLTTLASFYFRVQFTQGAPALLDIGHPYRLLSDAVGLVYGPDTAGRLIIGPSWRVAPGFDESDGVYEILLVVDKPLGSGSAVVYLYPPANYRSKSGVHASGEVFAPIQWTV
eukprot:jgi/Mesvir1/15819/Mv03375-RA.1